MIAVQLIDRVPNRSRGTLVKLATSWGSQKMVEYGEEVAASLLNQVRDENASDKDRADAATQLVDFRQDDNEVVTSLMNEITPQAAPELAKGIVQALGASQSERVGSVIVERLPNMTPTLNRVALGLMLKRPSSTRILLSAAKDGKASLLDLPLDQQQMLASHPNREIREEAARILKDKGKARSWGGGLMLRM